MKRESTVRHSPLTTNHCSLVLTGFMGTGKTSVGKIVAEKLGYEFIDMDAVIEAREEMTIREIFETRGEEYFRARESALCQELGARNNLVIATGGGALVSAQNRVAFVAPRALVICLDASAEEIMMRVGNAPERPMLAGDARVQVEELLAARRTAYAQIETHVDTTGKSVVQVAVQVMELWQSN